MKPTHSGYQTFSVEDSDTLTSLKEFSTYWRRQLILRGLSWGYRAYQNKMLVCTSLRLQNRSEQLVPAIMVPSVNDSQNLYTQSRFDYFQQLSPNCRTEQCSTSYRNVKGTNFKKCRHLPRNYLENPVFTRPRAKNLEHKTPWVSQNTKTPTKYFTPRQYTPTAYYYLNRPGKTCIHPLVLDTIAKIWAHSMGYTLDTRHAPMTSDEPAVKKISTLFKSTHACQSHPACQARIRTKCDDTLPPTSDCVCFMARPWPHLFECWQTYYQHAPAQNDVFV